MAEKTPKIDETQPVGLVLNLKGAPETPHTVVGLRGQYRPTQPTPIGGEGEVTLDEAKAAIEAGAPVDLVNIAKTKLDDLRKAAAEDLALARMGAVQARKDEPTAAEADVINDHADAVKEQ